MPVNVKLAKRDPASLARLRERAGERETGNASFIIQGGTFAMPVNVKLAKRDPVSLARLRERAGDNQSLAALLQLSEMASSSIRGRAQRGCTGITSFIIQGGTLPCPLGSVPYP